MNLTESKLDDFRPLNLIWGANKRDDCAHVEWHAPCGCAFHPEPHPHVHSCSTHMQLREKEEEMNKIKPRNESQRGNVMNHKEDHEWHVQLNRYSDKSNHKEMGWMYEAKRAYHEIPRLARLFEAERLDMLPKIHKQCSHSEPEPIKENYLTCCLGKRCSECEFLKALDNADIAPVKLDEIKAITCVTHIIQTDAKQFIDTSEGYILRVDDKMFWDNVYESMSQEQP